MPISKDELLMGRDKKYPNEYTSEISSNLDRLLIPMNKVRDVYGKPMTVNSGWRPSEVNSATPGAAAHSNHQMGLAVDIADPDGRLLAWVLANLDLMQDLGLFFEDFRWTKTWVHFQCVPPKSGKRIFIPYSDTIKNPMTAPNRWDGKYESKYDK
jgi:hypothetical protein